MSRHARLPSMLLWMSALFNISMNSMDVNVWAEELASRVLGRFEPLFLHWSLKPTGLGFSLARWVVRPRGSEVLDKLYLASSSHTDDHAAGQDALGSGAAAAWLFPHFDFVGSRYLAPRSHLSPRTIRHVLTT